MPDPFEKLAAFSKQIERNTAPGGPMDLLGQFFGQARAAMLNEMLAKRAAETLIPEVRQCLENAWTRSGLDKNSKTGLGQMYAAAVKKAIIEVAARGIKITLASGAGKNFYAWAGALLHGAVHGPREHRQIRDTITGRITGYKKVSIIGARAKRSIKKAALANQPLSKRAQNAIERDTVVHRGIANHEFTQRKGAQVGQFNVRKAYNFWDLTALEIEALQTRFLAAHIDEINEYLKGHLAKVEKEKTLRRSA